MTYNSMNSITWYDQGTAMTAVSNYFYQQTYVTVGSSTTNVQAWIPQNTYILQNQTCQTVYCQSNFPAETKRQRVERKLADRKWRREYAKRKKRATEALVSVLTDEQRRQFEADKHFELTVNGRVYRVRPGSRVERLDPATKKVASYFCIHPPSEYDLPSEDVALTQKLLLETAEPEFLRIANETKAA